MECLRNAYNYDIDKVSLNGFGNNLLKQIKITQKILDSSYSKVKPSPKPTINQYNLWN